MYYIRYIREIVGLRDNVPRALALCNTNDCRADVAHGEICIPSRSAYISEIRRRLDFRVLQRGQRLYVSVSEYVYLYTYEKR